MNKTELQNQIEEQEQIISNLRQDLINARERGDYWCEECTKYQTNYRTTKSRLDEVLRDYCELEEECSQLKQKLKSKKANELSDKEWGKVIKKYLREKIKELM